MTIADTGIQVSTADPIISDPLLTTVCCVFVMFYAFRRYDTPETNRLSTTRSLFLITGAGYVLVSLIFYFVLCEIILKPGILSFLGESVEDAQKFVAKYSAPPILAAVVLTTLLPNIRLIRDWDAWVLKRFQNWGSIPFGVYNLAEEVMGSEPPTEQELGELRDWMAKDGDVPNELLPRVSAEAPSTPRGSLTRALRMLHAVEKLNGAPGYAKVVRHYASERQQLSEEFRVYAAISQAFFVLFDYLQPLEGAAGENAKKQARERFEEISTKQSSMNAQFVAQLLLAAEGSEDRITKKLTEIGLQVREHQPLPLPIGPLVFVGAVIVALILTITSFVPQPPPPPGSLPLPVVVALIGITKTIGAFAAVLPKLCWNSSRASGDGQLPYLPWLGWGALAAAISLCIERLTLAALNPPISTALDFQGHPLTPIAPTTFVICVSIAMLCDLNLPLGNGWIRRMLEGAVCGGAMVVAIIICFHQLDLSSPAASHVPPWVRYALPFSVGFLLGAVAPYQYRLHRREIEEGRQTPSPVLGAAPTQ